MWWLAVLQQLKAEHEAALREATSGKDDELVQMSAEVEVCKCVRLLQASMYVGMESLIRS